MRAFLRKEWMELYRTGRFLVLLLVFVLFGIMNPALAKLTPWLMEILSESLEDAGLVTVAVTVDAMTSWAQFYKNIPIVLIIFILVNSGSFTAEYQKGTLIPAVTKGLSRRKIVLAKALVIFAAWTVFYLLCFGITYGYNAYFWDNGVAANLLPAAALTWLFGIWAAALLVFFSAVSWSGAQTLAGVGGVAGAAYVLGVFPRLGAFLPVRLMDGMPLLQGVKNPGDYYACIVVTLIMAFLCMALAVAFFEQKRL